MNSIKLKLDPKMATWFVVVVVVVAIVVARAVALVVALVVALAFRCFEVTRNYRICIPR